MAAKAQKAEADPQGDGSTSCNKYVIAAFVKRHRSAFKDCYQRELKCYPKLKGRIAFMFAIDTDGRVGQLAIKEDTLQSDTVAACMQNVMRKWIFPVRGTECVVVYPFVFAPAE